MSLRPAGSNLLIDWEIATPSWSRYSLDKHSAYSTSGSSQ